MSTSHFFVRRVEFINETSLLYFRSFWLNCPFFFGRCKILLLPSAADEMLACGRDDQEMGCVRGCVLEDVLERVPEGE